MSQSTPETDARLLTAEELADLRARNGGLGEYRAERTHAFLDALVWRGEQVGRLLAHSEAQAELLSALRVEWERLAILRELLYQWGELSALLDPPDHATSEALRKLVEETRRVLAMEG